MVVNYMFFDGYLFSLQARIAKKDLTLSELKSIEDEILLLQREEDPSISHDILDQINEKRECLMEKQKEDKSLRNIPNLLKISMLCDSIEEGEWEDKIGSARKSLKDQKKELKEIESIAFSIDEPLAHEFDELSIESTFASRMTCIAKMIREQNSTDPYKKNLNFTQRQVISKISGENPNPERLSRAVNVYVRGLRKQMQVAEVFYFGRVKEGMQKLSKLSEEIRKRVDELVWQSAPGERQVSPEIVVAALLQSVEEQMGMHEEIA